MSSSLNKFDRFSFWYLIGMSPFIIGFMIWAVYTDFMKSPGEGVFWDIFGWLFIAWVLDLIYLVTKMVFSRSVRDTVMTKLAGMKERDERESVVAGNAAKFSFLSTLALLIFLFVFSVSTLTISRHPKDINQKRGKVIIGFNIDAIDKSAIKLEKTGDTET